MDLDKGDKMIEKIFNYKIIIGASIVIFSLFTSGCVTTNEYNNYRNINESTETYDVKIEFHDDLENPYYRISTESMALSKNDLTQKEEFFISITRHKYESNPRVVNASVAIVYIGKIYRKMKPEMKMKINDDIASFYKLFLP